MKLEFNEAPARAAGRRWCWKIYASATMEPLLERLSLTVRHGRPDRPGRSERQRQDHPAAYHRRRTAAGLRKGAAGHDRSRSATSRRSRTRSTPADALETIRRLARMSETDAALFLHQYLFTGDEVFLRSPSLSFGERARLMLACLVAGGCNLLLLDEPINHLDIPSRARFEQALADFDGTVIAVVHDRFFISSFAATLWEIRQLSLVVTPLK